jgi:hypothetical protein
MVKSIKRMVLTGAAVMVMMSFSVPAMATVCQPTDIDCVEPPPADTPSDTPPGPQPQSTDTITVEPSTVSRYCQDIPGLPNNDPFCPNNNYDPNYNVDFGSPPVWWPW